MPNTRNFSPLLTNLRALAILIVVLGHSIILYDPSWTIYNPTEGYFPFMVLKRVINLIQMPLFYALSGYLFYWSVSKRDLKEIIKQKTQRVILPFVIVLLFYCNPLKAALHVPGYESMTNVLKHNLLLADLGHLWFLPVLFFLFILNYFTFKLTNGKQKIILLSFLLLVSYVGAGTPSVIGTTLYYWVFFYFGGLLNQWKFLERYHYSKHFRFFTGVLFLILILLGLISSSRVSIPISLLLIPCSFILMPNRNSSILTVVAALSFGIYLFHSPLIYITYHYLKDVNPWLVLSINFIVFGLLVSLMTHLIRLSKLRFIVGE